MGKLKIAIIGVGGIGGAHVQSYMKNPNVEVYAFCNRSEDRLKAQGEKYNVKRLYTDLKTMLDELPEIDAVSVCTCNKFHAEQAMTALKAGKHVLCEKPLSINAEQAQEMAKEATRQNKKLVVGFARRFGRDAEIIKDLIDKNALGEIYYAKASWLRANGNPGGWFCNKELSGGGAMIDLGVHLIDLVRYLCGNPKPISVYGATFTKLFNRPNVISATGYTSVNKTDRDVCDVEDLACAMIKFDNGLCLQVDTAFAVNGKPNKSVELFGTKGGASLFPELKIYTEWFDYLADINLDVAKTIGADNAMDNQINEFVDVILGKKQTRAPAEDGVEIMKILDAIYTSAKTGREVRL